MMDTNTLKRNILWGTATLLAVFAGLFMIWKMTSPANTPAAKPLSITLQKDDHILGDPAGKVVLVEYSDLQCPACKLYAPVVKALIAANPDIMFVYRHFPLEQHIHSKEAAAAAEAAGNQGKFFEFHDIMFDKQDEWAESKDFQKFFISYAQSLKLNINQFKDDMNLQATKKKVTDSYASGLALGVDSTPSFYLNGVKLENVQSLDAFQKLIDAEKAKFPNKMTPESSPSASVSPKK